MNMPMPCRHIHYNNESRGRSCTRLDFSSLQCSKEAHERDQELEFLVHLQLPDPIVSCEEYSSINEA